jgi:hypothetical protein
MHRNNFIVNFCVLFFLASINSRAEEQFGSAEALFMRRGETFISLPELRKQFVSLAEKAENNQKLIYSVDRYARLASFEGDLKAGRNAMEIYDECLKMTELIAPAKIGLKTAEYYYWRSSCLGLWIADASKRFSIIWNFPLVLSRLDEMLALIGEGEKDFASFEDNGFARLKAAILIRGEFLKRRGLYDPMKAIELINNSIVYSCYSNFSYILKAEAYLKLNNKEQAKLVLSEAIKQLDNTADDKKINNIVSPENHIFLERMRAMLKTM